MAVDTSQRGWFLCDTTHVGYQAFLVEAAKRHAEFWPNNVLSVVESDDKTESLVKVEGADRAWQDRVIPAGLLIDKYDLIGHHRAATLLRTSPEWSNTREVLEA